MQGKVFVSSNPKQPQISCSNYQDDSRRTFHGLDLGRNLRSHFRQAHPCIPKPEGIRSLVNMKWLLLGQFPMTGVQHPAPLLRLVQEALRGLIRKPRDGYTAPAAFPPSSCRTRLTPEKHMLPILDGGFKRSIKKLCFVLKIQEVVGHLRQPRANPSSFFTPDARATCSPHFFFNYPYGLLK